MADPQEVPMEVLVYDVPASAVDATALLNSFYLNDWRVVGTLHFGGNANAVIMQRRVED